ncbi:MAG TPA: penicillin acylase family protein [Gemmatimonadales bacterium]|nr:penicillin acylase family protein [Gemmatimonadales bacterium]
MITFALLLALATQPDPNDLSARVEIIRTAYGVPHIRARDLKAFGYGLAWVQLEDYGPRVAHGILRTRGTAARVFGRDSIETDFLARPNRLTAEALYPRLDQATRDVYEGFAAGVNRFVTLHRDQFAPGFPTDFSGYDVAAQDVARPNYALAARFVRRLMGPPPRSGAPGNPGEAEEPNPNEGSNAWALAPSRTRSKRAILLRNPHLAWDAGYYEAHATVPGVLDFYGDFRIGGPFIVIGGFNRDLGFATTNNNSVQDAIYALEVAPGLTDHVLLDGRAVALVSERVTVEYKNGTGFSSESREQWRSPLGPVIARSGGKVYVLRTATHGEYRAGEQFLRMMRARSLEEWKAAMRMNARSTSNFTYADRAGNIFYVWNATLPDYPHPHPGDSVATPVSRSDQVWTRLVPWDSLPQLLNPKGGYIHQENDPPHFTNLEQPMDSARLPATVPGPNLSLRSQLALDLLTRTTKMLTLEDVIRLKHSYRMLLADRVKSDLLAAIRAANDSSLGEAERILRAWDNTAAPDSRGGVLFEAWWRRYRPAGTRNEQTYAVLWSKEEPTTTPRGLADPARAITALRAAIPQVRQRYGSLAVPWGEVHRVRAGGKDVPVGGCGGDLGCFRVLQFQDQPDGKRAVRGGDGWVLAVEFGEVPRAYSVLGYGNSNLPGSPWNGDQGELFAKGELKRVAFTAADIEAQVVKRYRPGAR